MDGVHAPLDGMPGDPKRLNYLQNNMHELFADVLCPAAMETKNTLIQTLLQVLRLKAPLTGVSVQAFDQGVQH